MNQQASDKLFGEISRYINDSRAMLEKGRFLELVGLDEQVQLLCEAVLKLSQQEKSIYADKLEQIVKDLDALAEEMHRQKALVAGELSGMSTHRKANIAYQQADATDSFGKKNDE
jgi:hypothetical protein